MSGEIHEHTNSLVKTNGINILFLMLNFLYPLIDIVAVKK